MSKNEQKIKFQAEVAGCNKNIAEIGKTITNLNNKLKLNQEQLKNNSTNSNLLSDRVEILKQKFVEQSKIVNDNKTKLMLLKREHIEQTKTIAELRKEYDDTAKTMRRKF